MLVFCEDCGGQNIIDPELIKVENNQYRCTVCTFLNTYVPPIVTPSTSTVQKKSATSLSRFCGEKEHPTKKGRKTSLACASKPSKRNTLNTYEQPYSRVFKKIKTADDILGAFIFHFSDGLIAYDTDQQMTEETMKQIGKVFSVCSPFGHKILKKTKEVYLILDDQVAVCRNITTNSILVLFCDDYPASPAAASIFNQSINSLQVFI